MFTTHYRFGPPHTPRPLKYLIFTTLFISLFSAVADHIFPYYFGWVTPEQILSLSMWGIDHFFYWQFFTYLFVHPFSGGISFSFLISLAFAAYLLWIIGASLIEKKGLKQFFTLYFLSGLLSGLVIYFLEWMGHSPYPFSGNGAALYALLIAWLTLFPQAEFLLFLAIPVRASWLILSVLGMNLLIDLSTGDWLRASAYVTASIFGFLYSTFVWKRRGYTATPFHYPYAKKYDFKTGEAILNDDEFLDAMLTKIAIHGNRSLTLSERWRLRRIKRKRKKH